MKPRLVTSNEPFDTLWQAWHPKRRQAKGEARVEFQKALGRASFDDILAGAKECTRYHLEIQTDPRFIPHLRKWLKYDGWEDEYPEVKPEWSHKEQKYVRVVK